MKLPVNSRTRAGVFSMLAVLGSAAAAAPAEPVAAPVIEPGAAQARNNFARPVQLASDDVRAFAAPPTGFADPAPASAQGRVEPFSYQSAVTGTRRSANVYLPAGYSAQRRYPVLYLLHGIGGNPDEWTGYVRAPAVLDRLIADGKALPMIVVMPNGRALADDRTPSEDKIFTPAHAQAFAAFEQDLLASLMPAVDKAYATQPGREQRAIAGLSMGGGQALNFGLGNLDRFAWVGGFSAAPNTRAPALLVPDAEQARRQLKLLYLSCGNKDGLINFSQDVHRYLNAHKVPHVWQVDEFGHDRDSWAESLFHFAGMLFRPRS